MKKGKEGLLKEGKRCFVSGKEFASECFVSFVKDESFKFLSDDGFKKGENVTIQIDRKEKYESVPVFLSARIRKSCGSFGNGGCLYEAVLG
ncbi:MAG: hypothetical protein ACP5SD_07715 [Elusimicrobiales bacterium]